MKTCVLFTMIWHLFIDSSAKIINGYSPEITSAKASLKHLVALPQTKNVTIRLGRVKAFILYYELTEQLLQQFKEVAPDLFNNIDTIRDFRGRNVNVYVRFVPPAEMEPGARAITNLNQATDDKHMYYSEYGPSTVAIKVLTLTNSLMILAHEFGHVYYQVPHLAEYLEFFKTNYSNHHMRAEYLGHKPNDPSGQMAIAFEASFRASRGRFLAKNKKKHEHPLTLRDRIAKELM